MNHTGVCGPGSPRAARRNAESCSAGFVVEAAGMGRSSQVRRRVEPPPGRPRPTLSSMAAPDQPRIEPPLAPSEFRAAVAQMRRARFRSELFVEEMPAPQRIAPFASALSADVTVDGEETGSGRLVLLHDPAGNEAWAGTFRCVAYARAEIDPELVSDPLLAGVGWSWLLEALDAHGAAYAVPSGSITCVSSESFGGMVDEPAT